MQPEKKMPLNQLLIDLKERRILQNLFYYLIGALGLLASVYEISSADKIRRVFLILCITGIPIVFITSYFHGRKGKNPISAVEIVLLSICVLAGGGFAAKTLIEPKPITILVRMMEAHENWFMKKIINKFEKNNNCRVIIRRYESYDELVRILRNEALLKGKNNVSLAKIPLDVTLLLYKEKLMQSIEHILINKKFSKFVDKYSLSTIEDEYKPVALEMCSFSTITGKSLFFLPRKLETRLMIYRKSKVINAVKNWHKFENQINQIFKKENGYGLPLNYALESDVNKWDFYDLLVVGYYWANTKYDDETAARIAHRSKNYSGTVQGLIDKALQLGANKEDITDMYVFSDRIIDLFQWEAIFSKYNLYCKDMWEGDGWSGTDIYEGIEKDKVFLTWMHQLDSMLIYGSEELGIRSYIGINKEDLGIGLMPQGVSFELTEDGLPKRIGTKAVHTSGWFWGIPKNSPEPHLAAALAIFITSTNFHLEECKNFSLIPVRRDVSAYLKLNPESGWKDEIYRMSLEQLGLNADNFSPRFKTQDDYKAFLYTYYHAFEEIVIKKRYSLEGPSGLIDRSFIRECLR
jgi:ABC-type glycerol-3-phosphate transport system substrate-binding protein